MITPKAQSGIWVLTAPDGKTWQGDSPLQAVSAEQRERVPASVAMARIFAACYEGEGQAEAAQPGPMFWVRLRSDGGYEGPLHNDSIEVARKNSGAWTPLFIQASATSAPCSNPEIDKRLDAVLRASGSALRHYTMQKTLDDMRAAMRLAMQGGA